jgi:putative tryptophan/tyrosine transport system substrate-binding protein
MRRREALTIVLGGAAAPLAARAQTGALRRPLRVAITTRQSRSASFIVALQDRLRELGYVDGENLALDVRLIVGGDDRHLAAMRELVDLRPDILIASGPEAALKAAIAAASTLPIVMIAVDYDPIALGYVRSLANPGGNITGVVFQQPELAIKRVQIMKEALPGLTSATVVWDAASADQRKEAHRAAAELGLQLTDAEFRDQPYEYEAAFDLAGDRRALLVCVSPIFFRERQVLAAAALRKGAAAMFGLREFVEAGGLLSYGASISGLYRRAAVTRCKANTFSFYGTE